MNKIQKSRTEETEVSEFNILHLMSSILIEIFLRLPLESVIRCKSVCRRWYETLSEPEFINNYSKNPNFSTFLIPYKYKRVISHLCYIEICRRSGEFSHTLITPKSADFVKDVYASSEIGSCNGLLFTGLKDSDELQIHISNPITGDCIELPACRLPGRCDESRFAVYMFGFSRVTNNLKIMRIPFRYPLVVGEGEIFTVGVNKKWRKFPNPFPRNSVQSVEHGTVLNGIAHWILEVSSLNSIMTFDIENEIFGRISHPSDMVLKLENMVFVLNDKLCFIDYNASSETTIWTMQEYGVVDSWTKVVVSRVCISSSVFSRSLVAVALRQNGDIIFSHGVGEYALINAPELKTLLKSKERSVRRGSFTRILTYTPSFIPMENVIQGKIVKI